MTMDLLHGFCRRFARLISLNKKKAPADAGAFFLSHTAFRNMDENRPQNPSKSVI